jgi:FKBP-type peptidyl-prolyl cis-trans isomerase
VQQRRPDIAGEDSRGVGMKVGGTRELIIPPNLAYGNSDYGGIPKNAALIFDIKLLNAQ